MATEVKDLIKDLEKAKYVHLSFLLNCVYVVFVLQMCGLHWKQYEKVQPVQPGEVRLDHKLIT